MFQLLTHSRISSFKSCRKKHFYEYEHRVRRTTDSRALRMGTAYHAGLEALGHGLPIDDAFAAVSQCYENEPTGFDSREWLIEHQTVLNLLAGYAWRWESSPLEYVAVEQEFCIPLVNPETGRASTTFMLAGKIDGIVRLEDGRLAVKENKLLGDDISVDDFLWRRLAIDPQISIYVLAARELGYDVDCVLYDATRKPTIKPTDVPILDSDGLKIVLDDAGNRVMTKAKNPTPRQTADASLGYRLQTRECTAAEWGEKLNLDIGERPDFYYARREVPRLDKDLDELRVELWDIQKTLRDAQLNDRHYRTASQNTCRFCSSFDLCSVGFDPRTGTLPEAFVRLETLHPELEVTKHVYRTTAPSTIDATQGIEAGCPAAT